MFHILQLIGSRLFNILGFESLVTGLPYALFTKWHAEAGEPDPFPGLTKAPYDAWVIPAALTAMCCLMVVALFNFGVSLQLAAALIFIYTVMALTVMDIGYLLLPFKVSIPFLIAGLVFNSLDTFTGFQSSILGALIGYAVMSIPYAVGRITGKPLIGGGDAPVVAALGAWFGVQSLLALGLITCITFLMYAIPFRAKGVYHAPLGPALGVAGLIVLFIH